MVLELDAMPSVKKGFETQRDIPQDNVTDVTPAAASAIACHIQVDERGDRAFDPDVVEDMVLAHV